MSFHARTILADSKRALHGAWCLAACLLLAGCPSDQGRQADPVPPGPTFDGLVATGLAFQGGTITVGGDQVHPRSATFGPDGRYAAPLPGLAAPYVIGGSVDDDAGTTVFALTNQPTGTANVTPLTELVVLELVAASPADFFSRVFDATRDGLPSGIDFTPFTDAAIATAQATVVRVLRQTLGVRVPAAQAAADFVTTPFVAAPGDPMFDTLTAYQSALAAQGLDQAVFESQRVQEIARCAVEHLDIAFAGDAFVFCPSTKASRAAPNNPALQIITFASRAGDTLTLRVRDDALQSATLALVGQPSVTCSREACTGIALQPPNPDGSRTVAFTAAPLAGTGGAAATLDGTGGAAATLDGTLVTPEPGLPALDCGTDRNAAYLRMGDGTIFGDCYGLYGPRPSSAVSVFSDYGARFERAVELRTQGDAILSVVSGRVDSNTGVIAPEYACHTTACTGVTLGAIDPTDGRRTITLDRTPLSPVATDGSAGAGATLEGVFTTYVLAPFPLRIVPASPATQTVTARVGGESADWNICPPYAPDDGNVNGQVIDEFNQPFFPGSQIGDRRYGFVNSEVSSGEIAVIAATDGTIHRFEYGRFPEKFTCADAACLAGVTLGPANAAGAHAVTIAPIVLREIGIGDLPYDRTVQLQGQLLTAPDCAFDGTGCP